MIDIMHNISENRSLFRLDIEIFVLSRYIAIQVRRIQLCTRLRKTFSYFLKINKNQRLNFLKQKLKKQSKSKTSKSKTYQFDDPLQRNFHNWRIGCCWHVQTAFLKLLRIIKWINFAFKSFRF